MTRAEVDQINAGIDAFTTAANTYNASPTTSNAFAASSAASDEAMIATTIAAKHIGTPLSTRLVQFSGYWLATSTAISHGDATGLKAAEAAISGWISVNHRH